MGEAKRRKQRHASYGQIHQIRTGQDLEYHTGKLFNYFSKQCYENIEATNANLDEVNQRLADSVQKQLSLYKSSDRQLLATSLIGMYTEAARDYLEVLSEQNNQDNAEKQVMVLGMFLECLIKALKPWLNEEQQREFEELLAQRKTK